MKAKRYLIAAGLLATLAGTLPAAKADEQGEKDFMALREKVHALRPHQSREIIELIENTERTLTACLPGTPEPEDSRLAIALDDVDYLFGAPYTSTDGTYKCNYMSEPLHRPLTLDEARDFTAARMMQDIPHTALGKTGRARKAAVAEEGERRFAELRSVVSAGNAARLDPTSLGLSFRLDSPDLVDCSKIPYDELQHSALPIQGDNRSLYNSMYHFYVLDPDGPQRCIYVEEPFQRGLTAEEARDLLSALQLDLGLSETYRHELFGDGPVPAGFSLPPGARLLDEKKK